MVSTNWLLNTFDRNVTIAMAVMWLVIKAHNGRSIDPGISQ